MLTTLCLCLATLTSDLPPMVPGMSVPKPKLESPKASGERAVAMVRVAPAVVVIPQGFTITNITVSNSQVNLAWQQGTPPFQVYGATTLTGSWNTVGNTTLARSKAFPAGLNHFWKLRDQAPSTLTLNSNSQPRLTWTAPDTDMSDSLQNFTVEKSTDNQQSWGPIAENAFGLGPGVYPASARQANDATDPTTLPSKTVYYRLRQTTLHGVTVPYDVASLGTQAAGDVVWGLGFGGADTPKYVLAGTIGPDGSIYIAGTFRGTIDMSGHNTGGLAVLTAIGTGDNIFLAKYNTGGGFIWATRYGIAGTASCIVDCIVLDANGNIFVSGQFTGIGSLQKYNSAGVLQWTKGPAAGVAPGSNLAGDARFLFVDVDSHGNAVCSGTFRNDLFQVDPYHSATPITMDFGNGHNVLNSGPNPNACLARYDTDGNCLSARRIEPATYICQGIGGMAVDRRINPGTGLAYDNIFMAVSPSSTVDFGGGPMNNGTTSFYSALAKLLPDGTFDVNQGCWQRTVGVQAPGDPSYAGSAGYALSLDENGNVFVTGRWAYVANFGGGPRIRNTSVNAGYVAKYRGVDGSWMWDTAPASLWTDGNSHVAVSRPAYDATTGRLYVCGAFNRTISVGTSIVLQSINDTSIATGHNEPDGYIAVFSAGDGSGIWGARYGSDGIDVFRAILLGTDRKLVLAGYFGPSRDGNPIMFGSVPIDNTCTLTGSKVANGEDGLLLKIQP